MTTKSLNDTLRAHYMEMVLNALSTTDEVLTTNSNEFAIPCVDEDGNDKYVVLKFSVPTGSRDGDAYDGYAAAEDYKLKVAERAQKAKESAEKKAKKIAKDTEKRAQLAKAKAERAQAKSDSVDFEAPFEAGFETDIARKD